MCQSAATSLRLSTRALVEYIWDSLTFTESEFAIVLQPLSGGVSADWICLHLQENRSVAHGVPPTVGLDICMGLDVQCCIFGELIVCVRTVQVPTGYKYGNVGWDVPCTVQPCIIRSYVWDCGTGTLVPRGPYEGTEHASVEVREGQWQFYSC